MASFSTIVQDWNDMVVSLSLPRFEIIGLNGFMFQARDAIFDLVIPGMPIISVILTGIRNNI